jgi:hypothetical protein
MRMSILGKKGITPEMVFKCNDCDHTTTGQNIIDGEYLYIVRRNTEVPNLSIFRCECCQDDQDDKE